MTSHLDNHTTTDVKPEMIRGVQTGNGIPRDKYDIRGIAHARTNRKHNTFMQKRLYMYIEDAHTISELKHVQWLLGRKELESPTGRVHIRCSVLKSCQKGIYSKSYTLLIK